MKVLLRIVGALLIGVGGFGSFTATDHQPAEAQAAAGIYNLSARADGFGVELIATGLPVVPEGKLTYLSPSSAQASIDQFSASAFASAPYPGELIASLPTTINGLGSGTLPAFPAYPFYVASNSSSSPDARQEVGPYLLAAHSDAVTSTADARIGLSTFSPQVGSVTTRADVRRDPETGAMSAVATSHVAPLQINDLLSIGDVRSEVSMSFDPNDPEAGVQRTSSFSIGTVTIAGIELGLTENGLSLAGLSILPIDLSAVTALLAPSGVTVEYLPASETATSFSSAALAITYRETFPAPFLDTTVRFVLGRTSATLTTGTIPSAGGIPTPLAPTPTITAPAATPAAPRPAAGTGSAAPALPATPAAPAAAQPSAVPTTPASTAGTAPLADLHWFYPVLVGGALMALSGSRSVQWLSFRLRLAPEPTTGVG